MILLFISYLENLYYIKVQKYYIYLYLMLYTLTVMIKICDNYVVGVIVRIRIEWDMLMLLY